MSGPAVAHLTFTAGSQNGSVYDLPVGRFVVGRSTECDIVLTDAGVSGRHAEIAIDPRGRVTVADLGSLNGTWVDGERIDGAWGVGDGSRLAFGPISAVLAVPGAAAPVAAAPPPAERTGSRKALLGVGAAVVAVALLAGGYALAQALDGDGADDGSTTSVARTPATTATTATTAAKPKPKPLTREQRRERAENATLRVMLPDGWGSGFVVDSEEGRPVIVTNAHVVGDASEVQIAREGEDARPGTVRGVSQCDDLAVVGADDEAELPVLRLGAEPARDEELWIVGFPGTGTDQEGPLQIHRGTVARVGATYTRRDRELVATYRDLIQVDGDINAGNSGGPLVEQRQGRVVGVAAFGSEVQRENYGISVDRLREILPYLQDGSSVPGMALSFEGDDPEPRVVDVTSETLEGQGVLAGQRLVAVDGKRFDAGEFPNGLASLCDELPTLGDGKGTRVRYTFRKPDGNLLQAAIEY
jgi:S1-C subfamily serine protease